MIGGKTLTFIGNVGINNSGNVAFHAGFAGGEGIFTPTSLLVEVGQAIDGVVLTSIGGLEGYTNTGHTIFSGGFAGGTALFTQTNVIAKTGDVVAGKTLGFFNNDPGISDTQVATGSSFTDALGNGQGLFLFSIPTGQVIGRTLLEINTISLLITSIDANPIITGLVGITIAVVAVQSLWIIQKKKKKNE